MNPQATRGEDMGADCKAAEVLLAAAARASAAASRRAERLAGPDSNAGSAMTRELGTCSVGTQRLW
jgi:hypothetical protein